MITQQWQKDSLFERNRVSIIKTLQLSDKSNFIFYCLKNADIDYKIFQDFSMACFARQFVKSPNTDGGSMFRISIFLSLFCLLFSSYSFARCVYVNTLDKLEPSSSVSRFLFINGIAYNNYLLPNAENDDLVQVVENGLCKDIETKSQMDLIREFQVKMSKEKIECFVLHGYESGYIIKSNSTQKEIAASRFALKYLSGAISHARCKDFKGGEIVELVK